MTTLKKIITAAIAALAIITAVVPAHAAIGGAVGWQTMFGHDNIEAMIKRGDTDADFAWTIKEYGVPAAKIAGTEARIAAVRAALIDGQPYQVRYILGTYAGLIAEGKTEAQAEAAIPNGWWVNAKKQLAAQHGLPNWHTIQNWEIIGLLGGGDGHDAHGDWQYEGDGTGVIDWQDNGYGGIEYIQ